MPDLRERWRTSFIEATTYVAADLAPVMLRRARAEAERRGIHFIEFVEADVEALPFEDSSFDVVVTYTGLHCFPCPPAAIAEMSPSWRPRLRMPAW